MLPTPVTQARYCGATSFYLQLLQVNVLVVLTVRNNRPIFVMFTRYSQSSNERIFRNCFPFRDALFLPRFLITSFKQVYICEQNYVIFD